MAYVNNHRKDLEFIVGDQVFLRVSLMKRVIRFGKKGKLSPRYVKPFEILEKVRKVAYVIQPQVVQISEELSYKEDHNGSTS